MNTINTYITSLVCQRKRWIFQTTLKWNVHPTSDAVAESFPLPLVVFKVKYL
jgi:hypothetical protein